MSATSGRLEHVPTAVSGKPEHVRENLDGNGIDGAPNNDDRQEENADERRRMPGRTDDYCRL